MERMARQEREPVLSLRPKLEKNGTLDRIASHIQTSKTLQFLFDNADKSAAANFASYLLQPLITIPLQVIMKRLLFVKFSTFAPEPAA